MPEVIWLLLGVLLGIACSGALRLLERKASPATGRDELAKFIMNEANPPMACLGRVASYVASTNTHGHRIIEAMDEAMKREIHAIAGGIKRQPRF